MKFFLSCMAVAALLTASTAADWPNDKPIRFPQDGTPYWRAQALLLKQGLKIAPDQPQHPDTTFPECDRQGYRWQGKKKAHCIALFLERDKRGWRHYVEVFVDLETRTVLLTDYPSTNAGHPDIPPPLAKDVPQLEGSYFEAREKLKSLGFNPALHLDRNAGHVRRAWDSSDDVVLPEAYCSEGQTVCTSYWTARNGRILKVLSIWETPVIYHVEWSSRKDLGRDQREMRD